MSEKIIQHNEEAVKVELKELVRKSVEEMLNELLDKEAEELTGAGKYERTTSRQGYRSGHYSRKLTTTSGRCVSKYQNSKAYRSKQRSSNAIAAAKALTKRR